MGVRTGGTGSCGFSVDRLGLRCKSFRTLGSIGVGVRTGGVATFVKPSKYKGSAFLGALGHVGSLIRGYGVSKGILLSNGSVFGRVSRVALHRHIKVMFRRPGPFPGDVCSGMTCKPEVTKVGGGSRLSRVMREDLHRTTV